MAESSSSALNRTLDTIGKCRGPANYREWRRKVRQAFGLYPREMLQVLDEAPRPEETDADGVAAWETANNNYYAILSFLTEGSANITVRAHEITQQDCLGDGVAAWKSFKDFQAATPSPKQPCPVLSCARTVIFAEPSFKKNKMD